MADLLDQLEARLDQARVDVERAVAVFDAVTVTRDIALAVVGRGDVVLDLDDLDSYATTVERARLVNAGAAFTQPKGIRT